MPENEDLNLIEAMIKVQIEQIDSEVDPLVAIEALRISHAELLNNVEALKEEYGGVKEGVEELAKASVTAAQAGEEALEKQIKKTGEVTEETKGLIKSLKEALKVAKVLGKTDASPKISKAKGDGKKDRTEWKRLSKEKKRFIKDGRDMSLVLKGMWRYTSFLAVPTSLGAAIKSMIDYKKSILSTSAGVNRLGIGMSALIGTLERTANATALTRRETAILFDQYQKGMRFVSLQGFEGIMERIQSIVGANDQAIGEMQGAIVSLSGSFPYLAKELQNIDKLDKNLIANKVQALYWAGKIDEAQYRSVQSYISGGEQAYGQDKQRQKDMQRQVKTMQEFKRQAEKVAHIFAEMLLPPLTWIANELESLQDGTYNWTKLVGKLVAAFLVLKGAMLLPKILPRIPGLMASAGIITKAGAAANLAGGAAVGSTAATAAGGFGAAGLGGFLMSGPGALAVAGIIAGKVAMHYGGKYSEKYAEEGKFVASGKSQLVGAGGAIAAGAGTGAMIGSIFPVLGTAIGAVAGGLIGLAFSFGNVSEGLDKVFNTEKYEKMMQAEERAAEKYKKAVANSESKADRASEVQKAIEEGIIKDAKIGIDAAMKSLKRQQEAKEEELKKAEMVVSFKAAEIAGKTMTEEDDTGKIYTFEGGKEFKEGLAKDIKSLAIRESTLEVQKDSLGEKFIKQERENIIALKKQISIKEDALNLAGEETQEYKDAHAELLVIKGRQEEIRVIIKTQREILETINELYQAQTGHLDAMVASMAASGKIDAGALVSQTESVVESLKEGRSELLKIQNILTSGDLSQVDVLLASKEITEENKKLFKAYVDNNGLSVASLNILIDKEKVGTKLHENALKLNTAGINNVKAHEGVIKSMELQVTRANQLVQIADNYAIGVGASARMRMDIYNAEGRKIKELEKQLRRNEEVRAIAVRDGQSTLQYDNQRLEIQNKILDSTLAQNQAVKAMRDGWVSAISAMNTGAGGFSEIIMNAEQNTAQIMRLEGAVRSSTSGAFARRNRRGRVTEDIGYRRSERFGIGGTGDITGRGRRFGGRFGRRKEKLLSYQTEVDRRLGITREGPSVLQYRARDEAQKRFRETRKQLEEQGDIVGRGTGQALGATNQQIKGAIVAGTQAQVDAATEVKKEIKEEGKERRKKTQPVVNAPERVREAVIPGRKGKEKVIIPHSAAADLGDEEGRLKVIPDIDVSGLDPIVLKVIPDFIGLEEVVLKLKVNLGVTKSIDKGIKGGTKKMVSAVVPTIVETKVIEQNTTQITKLGDVIKTSKNGVFLAAEQDKRIVDERISKPAAEVAKEAVGDSNLEAPTLEKEVNSLKNEIKKLRGEIKKSVIGSAIESVIESDVKRESVTGRKRVVGAIKPAPGFVKKEQEEFVSGTERGKEREGIPTSKEDDELENLKKQMAEAVSRRDIAYKNRNIVEEKQQKIADAEEVMRIELPKMGMPSEATMADKDLEEIAKISRAQIEYAQSLYDKAEGKSWEAAGGDDFNDMWMDRSALETVSHSVFKMEEARNNVRRGIEDKSPGLKAIYSEGAIDKILRTTYATDDRGKETKNFIRTDEGTNWEAYQRLIEKGKQQDEKIKALNDLINKAEEEQKIAFKKNIAIAETAMSEAKSTPEYRITQAAGTLKNIDLGEVTSQQTMDLAGGTSPLDVYKKSLDESYLQMSSDIYVANMKINDANIGIYDRVQKTIKTKKAKQPATVAKKLPVITKEKIEKDAITLPPASSPLALPAIEESKKIKTEEAELANLKKDSSYQYLQAMKDEDTSRMSKIEVREGMRVYEGEGVGRVGRAAPDYKARRRDMLRMGQEVQNDIEEREKKIAAMKALAKKILGIKAIVKPPTTTEEKIKEGATTTPLVSSQLAPPATVTAAEEKIKEGIAEQSSTVAKKVIRPKIKQMAEDYAVSQATAPKSMRDAQVQVRDYEKKQREKEKAQIRLVESTKRDVGLKDPRFKETREDLVDFRRTRARREGYREEAGESISETSFRTKIPVEDLINSLEKFGPKATSGMVEEFKKMIEFGMNPDDMIKTIRKTNEDASIIGAGKKVDVPLYDSRELDNGSGMMSPVTMSGAALNVTPAGSVPLSTPVGTNFPSTVTADVNSNITINGLDRIVEGLKKAGEQIKNSLNGAIVEAINAAPGER